MTFAAHDSIPIGTTLAYTRFFFLRPDVLDDKIRIKLRGIGDQLARGFFNVFDLEGGARDLPPHEMIQFFTLNGHGVDKSANAHVLPATHVVQVTSKYRPSMVDAEKEIRRRVGTLAEVSAIRGAVRTPRYTSSEMYTWAYGTAKPRASGRIASNSIILPIRKTAEWWAMPAMERHQYFYPHRDQASGATVPGHAELGRKAAGKIHRRLYYNPDGEGRAGEWDFITYFECADDDLGLFDETLDSMRDTTKNPEWNFVEEGPLWRGTRSLRW